MIIFHICFIPDFSAKLTHKYILVEDCPLYPDSGSNISRNYFLFRKAGYIFKLFNIFQYFQHNEYCIFFN